MTSSSPVRLSKSSISDAEIANVERILRTEFLGMGSEVKAFERELSEYIGGRAVLCVNTGTSALQLALQAVGVGAGDEVLVPSITYVASFQAVSATGARPVACDVRPEDAFIDLADAAKRLTPRTRAIMPVHYASGPGDMDGVYAFAARHKLRVVEDAAHAFGCRRNGAMVGALGDVVCFSFDGIKNITSGEGGAVVTGDEAVAAKVRDLRLLGVHGDSEKRYSGGRSWDIEVSEQGWRYHMSDIFAALGRIQLARLETEFAPKRVAAARRYRDALHDVKGLRLINLDYGEVVPHIFPVFIDGNRREAVRQTLLNAGIGVGLHYKPNHLLSYYTDGFPRPVAEMLYEQMLTLPLHVDLTAKDQDRIVHLVRRALADMDG